MLNIPIIRWGKEYKSLESDEVVHFDTGESIATLGRANGGLVQRDVRKAQKARDLLREIPPPELLEKCKEAGRLYNEATLPMGDGTQTPDEFVHAQSASTGMPEHMCRSNMAKCSFVLENMEQILDCLTRGLDLEILSKGYGTESRGVVVSYQAQTPILAAVLPSNSPGVHTLWLPAVPLQMGLVLKPGSSEPWTPYRMYHAFVEAGIPAEAFCLYPGAGGDVGNAILSSCSRSMVFGSQQTIDKYAGNPRVQPHGPGFSKILLGEDKVDQWEDYLDVMVESIFSNGGRSCINASSVWAPRHTKEIAQALAERLGPVEAKPPTDPEASLAAFANVHMAEAVWSMVETDLKGSGVMDMTASYGDRYVGNERSAYIRPIIAHANSADCEIAVKEYMFPFASVVECPQAQMLRKIGSTLVGTAITEDPKFIAELTDSIHIDRLNIGPIPTNRLNWLQPHEGNLIDFLFRSRAYQVATQPATV
jgi:acyl-CoA reductase-like NAD-dependent aldehyde dehydrogenase